MKDKYQKVKDFYSQVGDHKTGEFVLGDKLDEFLSHIKKDKTIIDAGCGPGHDVDYFFRQGYRAIGLDFSDEYIRYARGKYQGRFEVADLLDPGIFDKYRFDNAWISAVLMHLDKDDLAIFLKNLFASMPGGGCLGILTPEKIADDAWQKRWQDNGGVLNTYTKDELEEMISQAGFTTLSNKGFFYLQRPWIFMIALK